MKTSPVANVMDTAFKESISGTGVWIVGKATKQRRQIVRIHIGAAAWLGAHFKIVRGG